MSHTSIIAHMRDTFLLCAYMEWSDEEGRTRPRQNFTAEAMPKPATRIGDAAWEKAEELYKRITKLWDAYPLVVLNHNHCGMAEYKEWGHYAVTSALGMGVRWEDDHDPLVMDGKTYTVKGIHTEGLEMWEGANPPPINYEADSQPRILNRDQACTIAMHWHDSMEDPIYAFSSTGCIQSDTHRYGTQGSIMRAIENTLENWNDLHPFEETADSNTQRDIQDLADLLVYVTNAPIQEVP